MELPDDKVDALVGVMESTLRQSVAAEVSPEELVKLGQACQELYRLRPSQDTFDAISGFIDQVSCSPSRVRISDARPPAGRPLMLSPG